MLSRAIHTLNGRNNSLMPALWSYAGGDPFEFQGEMEQTVDELTRMLLSRGVDYSQLKNALIPNDARRQVAFLYDWFQHPPQNYAVEFSRSWLPALRPDIRTSMLTGDLLPPGMPGETVDAIVPADDRAISWNTLFAVFFSNLSDADVDALHRSMKATSRYRGYVDLTFASPVRDFLADTLTFPHVFFGKKVITAHDGDDFSLGDHDMIGYPFSDHGYEVVSLNSSYVLALLHYKIETQSSPDSLDDLTYSLAAATGETIDDLDVVVNPSKVAQYLLKDPSKRALMESIGLGSVSAKELSEMITERLRRNYIYDLKTAGDARTPTFAVSGEFIKPDGSRARRLIALKYDVDAERISLVSMY